MEEKFAPHSIFLEKGYQFVLTHAIRSSNHPFMVGMTFLPSQAALMNGASVDIFPGSESPLHVMAVLANYPQTRKSQNSNDSNNNDNAKIGGLDR